MVFFLDFFFRNSFIINIQKGYSFYVAILYLITLLKFKSSLDSLGSCKDRIMFASSNNLSSSIPIFLLIISLISLL